jgi:hypothetical protein
MKTELKHPSHTSMLTAIRKGTVPFQVHLKQCETCRNLFELLKQFPLMDSAPIVEPNAQAIERHTAIPLLCDRKLATQLLKGTIVFDSWSQQPSLQLRDVGTGFMRRLRLKAREITLEIVAQRHQRLWEFTARVYRGRKASYRWVLRVGGKKLLPQSLGFYHWSSKRAPRSIRLSTRSKQIDFEKLAWE